MNKIILSIFCLFLIPCFSFAQNKNLAKAVKKGKDEQLRYTAGFKNLSLDKKSKIKKWCRENGYVVVKLYVDEKDVFGGNKKKYITVATFRTLEDDLYLRSTSENTIYLYSEYLDKFPKGIHLKEIENKLIKAVDQLTTCKKLSERYPYLFTQMLDRAFDLAKIKNKPYLYTTFLRHFPDSKYENQIFQFLCESMPDIKTTYKFYKKYSNIKECLDDKAYALAKKSKKLNKYSEYINTFKEGENLAKAEKTLIDNLKSISLCSTYYSKHPYLKSRIDDKAITIAEKGGIEFKREYSELMTKGKKRDEYIQEVAKYDKAVAAEAARKEKERKEKELAEALAVKKEKERKARIAKEKKEQRLAKIRENKIVSRWKRGDKICASSKNNKMLQGVIDDFNSDRSKIKIKIIQGNDWEFDGQKIFLNEYIWTNPELWYKCIGDENVKTSIVTKKEYVDRKQSERISRTPKKKSCNVDSSDRFRMSSESSPYLKYALVKRVYCSCNSKSYKVYKGPKRSGEDDSAVLGVDGGYIDFGYEVLGATNKIYKWIKNDCK